MEGLDFEEDVDEPPESSNEETAISSVKQRPLTLSSGLISKAKYVHKSKNCDIQSVTYNSKTGDYIIVDSRGITTWAKSIAVDKTSRLMEFPAYQFNVIKILLYCRKFNVYFALSKDYQLKVYNLNFHETFSVESDTNSVIHMLFNAETNELITASTGELQFWQFGEMSHQSDLLHAKYGLILVKKWEAADGKLISRLRLDEELQRLYCLSEKDIWCYDMMGRLIFKITEACQVHLSACAYSIPVHTLIVGSIDGQVNVLTTTGGKIHTFYSHIGLITEILVHPSDYNLVISSSLDGYIKIFSLDIFEELYSFRVFDNGIEYMALRSNDLLYCASVREIEIFNLNYFYQFWGQLRYPAQRIELVQNAQKSRRVLALAEDGSVRLFADTDGRKLCTVLPPPSVSATSRILDCVHDRDYSLVYLLVKSSEVWVYTTKTDPACHLAIVNLWKPRQGSSRKQTPMQSPNHSNAMLLEDNINCNCIDVLQDLIPTEFVDSNGIVHDKCNFLACGMDSGEIVLFNPLRNGQKEKSIKICKDPIIKMKYYRAMLTLMLLTKAKEGVFIQIFNSGLQCITSVGCNDDLAVFSLKDMTLAAGFLSGHVVMLQLSTNDRRTLELVKGSVDHQSSVQSVSFHPTLDILCSAAKDSCIKIWSTDKTLLCDINFEAGLTTACFLNSLGDILIGLKNQVFIIKHEGKLAWLADEQDSKEQPRRRESEIYESPYLKYDIRRPISPESENMEKYLVPYQDMMFSSIGSWVVAVDDSESDDADAQSKVDDFISDDLSSNAPSDIYQSSIHSDLTDVSRNYWWLPECVLSPEESIVSSDEETAVHQDEVVHDVSEDVEEALKPAVDPKAKLENLLAQSKRTFKNGKNSAFLHNASEKLKNARIDLKTLRKSQNAKATKNTVAKKDTESSSQTKANSKTRMGKKSVRKANKSMDERRRVARKERMDTDQSVIDDNDATTQQTLEQSIDDVASPDPGYQSQASLINEGKLDAAEKDEELTESGVLLSNSKAISLTKVSSTLSQNKELTDEGAVGNDTVESSKVDDFRSMVEQPSPSELAKTSSARSSPVVSDSKKTSRTHTASSLSAKSRFSSAKTSSDKAVNDMGIIDQDNEYQPPPSLSSSSLSSYAGSSSDFVSEDEFEEDEDSLSMNLDDARTQENLSSMKSSSAKPREHFLKGIQQEDVKVKVVPAFSQQLSVTVDTNNRIPSRGEQNIPLTVYSLSNRSASRVSSIRTNNGSPVSRAVSRQQQDTPVKSSDDTDSANLSRQSKSPSRLIRIPFGQINEQDTFMSSSSIKRDSAKKQLALRSPEPKEERKKGDLVNFCVSALKQKNKIIGRDSPLRSGPAKPPDTALIIDDGAAAIEQVSIHNSNAKRQESPPQTAVVSSTRDLDAGLLNHSRSQNSRESNQDYKFSQETSFNVGSTKTLTKEDLMEFGKDYSFVNEILNSSESLAKQNMPLLYNQRDSHMKGNYKDDNNTTEGSSEQRDRHIDSVYIHTGSNNLNSQKHTMGNARTFMHHTGKPVRIPELQSQNEVNEIPMDIYRRAKSILTSVGHKNERVNKSRSDLQNVEEQVSISSGREDLKARLADRGNSDAVPKEVLKLSRGDAKVCFELQELRQESRYDEVERKGIMNKDHHVQSEEKIVRKSLTGTKETRKFDEKYVSDFQREGSKGKLIFVNVPVEDEKNDDRPADDHYFNYREEVVSPISLSSYDLNTAKGVNHQTDRQSKISCVASLHEKLLKRRALNASMKERQASAKFRREVIEKQKLARCRSKNISPSFSQEYTTEYLQEAVPITDNTNVTYEYNTPVPLPDNTRKPSTGINRKSLEARLSGQAFRHGKSIPKDENEDIILDFIKSSITKEKKNVVLLPRPKSSPSIPAKCHDYVLVKETNKHTKALSKLERDLLTKRFSEFSIELT